jgi:hypothetical protein
MQPVYPIGIRYRVWDMRADCSVSIINILRSSSSQQINSQLGVGSIRNYCCDGQSKGPNRGAIWRMK